MIGQEILHYKIIEKLGEGGMGVVYKAEDTKLERIVALKFLSTSAIGSDEEKKRFKREAKAAAGLNHPNIAHIYAIDEEDDKLFIAMEFIEGKSLAEIVTSPLPLDKAIDYATQTAASLQAAHEKGIIHRDIKSANIMVTENGQAKIMDFGLAKLADHSKMTQLGITLGTVAYMSPEQAQGMTVDHRTDIWSLGVVMYEMISGQLPFVGDYESAVIYSILNEESEALTALRTGVPMELERIVKKSLSKDPALRYQHMNEVSVDLRAIKIGLKDRIGHVPVNGIVKDTLQLKKKYAVLTLVVAFLLGTLTWNIMRTLIEPPDQLPPLRKYRLNIVGELPLQPFDLAISPDGKMVTYIQDGQLWIRRLAELEPRKIPGTEGATQPFWSPESDFVGYVDDLARKLKKVNIERALAITICDLPASWFWGATWGSDGTIVFSVHEGLFQVSNHGGQAKLLLKPEDNGNAVSPLFTAAGDLIYSIWTEGNSRIVHISEGSIKTLFKTQGRVHSLTYSPSGHLLFEKEPHTFPGIWGVELDYETLATSSTPFLIDQDGTRPSVSRDGTLVFVSSSGTHGLRRLVWMDRAGNFLGSIGQPQYGMEEPALSPDGGRVAVSASEGGNNDIWIHDVLRGTKTRLTSHPAFDFEPTWSPSGDEVAFASARNGSSDIIIKAIDGSGRVRTITTLESGSKGVADWSHDGKYILYFVNGLGLDFDIGYSSLDSGKATLFLKTPFYENEPVVSPDGKYLAYTSNETGRYEVYVSSFPENKGRVLVSLNGGMHPKWSGSGAELFYKERDALMTVPVDTRSGFKAGTPQKLFDKEGAGVNLYDNFSPIDAVYDVSADGQKFVMLESLEKITSNLIIVENWAQQFRFENEDIK